MEFSKKNWVLFLAYLIQFSHSFVVSAFCEINTALGIRCSMQRLLTLYLTLLRRVSGKNLSEVTFSDDATLREADFFLAIRNR